MKTTEVIWDGPNGGWDKPDWFVDTLEERVARLEEHLSGKHDQRSHGRHGTLGVADSMSGLDPRAQAKIRARASAIGLEPAAMTENMNKLYDSATPQQLKEGMEWYESVGNHAEATGGQYGIGRSESCAVYAALSPARNWDTNLPVGDRVLHVVGKNEPFHADPTLAASARPPFAGGRVRPGDLTAAQLAWTHPDFQGSFASSPDHYGQVGRAISLARGDTTPELGLTGPKTRSFHNNMFDPTDHTSVTLDSWMLRTEMGPDTMITTAPGNTPVRVGDQKYSSFGSMMTSAPTIQGVYPKGSGIYPLMADAVSAGAATKGVLPQQYQAVVWVVARDAAKL